MRRRILEAVMVDDVQTSVREKYGEIAKTVTKNGFCGPTACGCGDPIGSNLYADSDTSDLPPEAVAVSLGCGNPTALLKLEWPSRAGSRVRRRHRRPAFGEA